MARRKSRVKRRKGGPKSRGWRRKKHRGRKLGRRRKR